MSTLSRTTEQIKSEAKADIEELKFKIDAFRKGELNEDKFKHFRLTRGVYGQRQLGVHMFRTKIPFGHVTSAQLYQLAEISDRYATGNLHITTRQNIQFHYVKLDNSTKVWDMMAEVGMNAREACGNTVRNITASANAGIDPNEPFDITPYVVGVYNYFLRNPICQEMGRKIKIAFSSSEEDSAFTYFHDFGFIPRINEGIKGFKLVLAGGLGAQAMEAVTVSEFIPADEIIPFMEATIRIFDRYGEREKRFKARMKFLLKSLGEEKLFELINEELEVLPQKKVSIDEGIWKAPISPDYISNQPEDQHDKDFQLWKKTNVIPAKNENFVAVNVKVRLGDLSSDKARSLSKLVPRYFADDIRFTLTQGILLRLARKENLYEIYTALKAIGLAEAGAETFADVTACPGTDTCNLAVTNSTDVSEAIESHLITNHPKFAFNKDLSIKISGCMNSCGQHMAASIGFHGSSFKNGDQVVPALQIVLGGGVINQKPYIAEKIIKVPTKRVLNAISILLDDYEVNAEENEHFTLYVHRIGKRYFYDLLKDLADKDNLQDDELLDWGQNHEYVQAIGVGECAGVAFDMLSAIIKDADEKIEMAFGKLEFTSYSEAIYHAYTAFVVGAKALLLSKDIKCNTHIGILEDFENHFQGHYLFPFAENFVSYVLRMKEQNPDKAYALKYVNDAQNFVALVKKYRSGETTQEDLLVTESYYKA